MNKLIDEVLKFREAFVIAVGDQSPFAKVALGRLDAAIEEAKMQLPLIMTDEQAEQFSGALDINAVRALLPFREMDILDPIREAVYNVRRDGFDVVKIHITRDFKLRVRANIRPITTDMKELLAETILGYPVEVHEEAEKDWWVEDNAPRICYNF